MLLILLIAEGDMPRRASVPEFVPDDRIAVLAFESADSHSDAVGCQAMQDVFSRHWVYQFDPEQHPNAARLYVVTRYPTYIVQVDGREVWRTDDPVTLAEGLAWNP